MDGLVFNTQKFCLNDGPGIRTTVFLKGCPLRCMWCHNPESHLSICEVSYNADKCERCGKCVPVCKSNAHSIKDDFHIYYRELCNKCGECAIQCPTNAIEIIGKYVSADELINEIIKDKVFYDCSGGGLTISGGEPFMQFDFVYELLQKAKDYGIHTCIETSGFADTEKLCKVAEYTDIFLYDWKMTNDCLHKKYTGVSNKLIKQNLYAVDKLGVKIILRCPIIPGVNDNEEHFEGIANLANTLKNILSIELVPYHSFGNSKYEMLYGEKEVKIFKVPTDEEVKKWILNIQKHTNLVVKKA